jgi:hypothetical protein
MRIRPEASARAAPRTVVRVPVRRVGLTLGLLRCAIGGVMILDPPRLARLLGVDSLTARQTGWLTLMIGGREVGLGAGSLFALRRGACGRSWYAAQAVTDGGDALAMATAVRAGRVSAPIGSLIAVSSMAGAALDLAAMRADGGRPG